MRVRKPPRTTNPRFYSDSKKENNLKIPTGTIYLSEGRVASQRWTNDDFFLESSRPITGDVDLMRHDLPGVETISLWVTADVLTDLRISEPVIYLPEKSRSRIVLGHPFIGENESLKCIVIFPKVLNKVFFALVPVVTRPEMMYL